VAADALRVGAKGPWLSPALVNHDTEQARRTVGKIARLEVEEIYVGHVPPTTKRAVMTLVEKLAP